MQLSLEYIYLFICLVTYRSVKIYYLAVKKHFSFNFQRRTLLLVSLWLWKMLHRQIVSHSPRRRQHLYSFPRAEGAKLNPTQVCPKFNPVTYCMRPCSSHINHNRHVPKDMPVCVPRKDEGCFDHLLTCRKDENLAFQGVKQREQIFPITAMQYDRRKWDWVAFAASAICVVKDVCMVLAIASQADRTASTSSADRLEKQ